MTRSCNPRLLSHSKQTRRLKTVRSLLQAPSAAARLQLTALHRPPAPAPQHRRRAARRRMTAARRLPGASEQRMNRNARCAWRSAAELTPPRFSGYVVRCRCLARDGSGAARARGRDDRAQLTSHASARQLQRRRVHGVRRPNAPLRRARRRSWRRCAEAQPRKRATGRASVTRAPFFRHVSHCCVARRAGRPSPCPWR